MKQLCNAEHPTTSAHDVNNTHAAKFLFGFASLAALIALGIPAYSQTAGEIRGSVVDPSGAVIPGATVQIENPVSHYTRETMTDSQGTFSFPNVPFNNYHVTASATGFASATQDIDLRSSVPLQMMSFRLELGAAASSVTVEAGTDLVETQTSTHTDVDRALIDKLPVETQSSPLSSMITLSTPGVAADSNGLIHGLGDHAENSFSLDGQPIDDQQSKVFSNEIPADAVQSMEVIEGAPPAEYGDKTSLIIVIATRSGLGIKPAHGDATFSYGTFATSTGNFDLAYGGQTVGNFITVSGLDTGRFLDTPEFQVYHDHGNEANVFDRFDFKPSDLNSFTVDLGYTRSWFQNPNSYDAQTADAWSGLIVNNGGLGPNGLPVGTTDQRSRIRTFNIAPTWIRLVNPNTVFTLGGFVRQDQYNYFPSRDPFADFIPDLQSETVGQNRRLTNLGFRTDVSYIKGIHNLKAGVTYQNTILNEQDTFGIVNPLLNPVCLGLSGAAVTNPALTNPSNCTGALQPNPSFVPLLACFDLTRTGPLPASDQCPNSTSALYPFHGHADVRTLGAYIQDSITMNRWTFNVGVRFDYYRGISEGKQGEPRLGISYNIKPTNTVLRVSYARTLETPFNENLVLASLGCSSPAVNALMSAVQGYPCVNSPLTPGLRNEFHAGLSQAFGRFLVIDGEYIWKYTHGAYDFSILGNTPITFPIEWQRSKIPGVATRVSMPNFHGLSAFLVLSSVSARFFEPQISGIGTTPASFGSTGVFRIDHDEKFNQTTHLQYQPRKNGAYLSFNWRYDSGLVAGPVPCAGGNCSNGPFGTNTVVDVSGLSPDQQFEAGLYCGNVHATYTTPISPNNLCPASQYGSTLLRIPAPGTENNDQNPPRVAPRNLFDLGVGHDNIFHTEKYRWSASVTVVNLTNRYALYNFLSTFSGTHYVTPRAITGAIGFHF